VGAWLSLTACDIPSNPQDDNSPQPDLPFNQEVFQPPAPDVVEPPDIIFNEMETPSETWLLVNFDIGTFEIDAERFRWRVRLDGTIIRRSSSDASPLEIELTEPRPSDVFDDPRPPLSIPRHEWTIVSIDQPTRRGPITMTLEDSADDAGLQVQLQLLPDSMQGGLRIEVDVTATGREVRRIAFNWEDIAGPLYGTGQRFDRADGRGTQRALFHAPDFLAASGHNDVFVAVPWVLNPTGYGLFVESDRAGVFDLGAERESVLSARFDMSRLSMRLWIDSDPLNIIRQFTALTGRPRPLPSWAFATQLARPGADAEQLRADAEVIRNLDLAVGGLWINEPWTGSLFDATFDLERFPNPETFVQELNDQGFDLVLQTQGVLNSSNDSAHLGLGWTMDAQQRRIDALGLGHLLVDSMGQVIEAPWGDNNFVGSLIDFSSVDARAWWLTPLTTTLNFGVRGLILNPEPILLSEPSSLVNGVQFSNGNTSLTDHLRYYDAAHDTLREGLGGPMNRDGLVLGSMGTTGSAAFVDAIVIPPLRGDFSPYTPSLGGGLPAALAAALSLSTSGFPFFALGAGGGFDTRPSDEAMSRWLELGSVMPMMHLGGSGGVSRLPWEDPYTSIFVLNRFRAATQRRIQLSYYFDTLAREVAMEGLPLLRPMSVMMPFDPETFAIEDQFFIGEDMMVAPILEAGLDIREVYMPSGAWRNWSSGAIFNGQTRQRISASPGQIPIFVRDGSLIPVRLDTIETLRSSQNPDVLDAEIADQTYHIRIFGRATGNLDLPGGARLETRYQGASLRSELSFEPSTTVQGILVEFIGAAPSDVQCGGSEVPENNAVAVIPVSGTDLFAFRRLPTGVLIRFPAQASCQLFWPELNQD